MLDFTPLADSVPATPVSLPEDGQRTAAVRAAGCGECHIASLCFQGVLGGDDRGRLERHVRHTSALRKGQFIFRQGDAMDRVAIVRSGGVKLLSSTPDGVEQIVEFCLPGDVIGLDGLAGGVHQTSAQVLDSAVLCEIPASVLTHACTGNPGLLSSLLASYAQQVATRDCHILGLAQRSAEGRLAAFLLGLGERMQQIGCSSREFYLPMARQDIASYLALAVETVSRLFTQLQRDAVLEVERRLVRIRSAELLAASTAATPRQSVH